MLKLATAFSLLAATTVYANNPIPENYFTDAQGLLAAQAGAPMWHMASGSCLPSAAEDGQGHQTNGVDVPVILCAGQKLDGGCPGDSTWRGSGNWWYHDAPGEPFADIPTYFYTKKCAGDIWRIYYGVYFKKDVSHKSDWEYAIMQWKPNGNGGWVRDAVSLEVDGKRGGGWYGGIPNTFDNSGDQFQDGNRDRDHPKFYFGKHHHAVHWDTYGGNKNTCSAGTDDFRANDFQFWSKSHLRHIDFIGSNWDYGKATNPHHTDVCGNF